MSICIPAYNQVSFLKKCLDSLLDQDFKNYEVILSDDSTSDEVQCLVENYNGRLNLRYFRNPAPLGSPANWNRCIDLAEGDYIKFMHHDDWFAAPSSLNEFVRAATLSGAGFIFCASSIMRQSDQTTSMNRPSAGFLRRLKKDPTSLFSENRIGAPSATMYRNQALRFDEKLKFVVDIDFYIRFLSKSAFYYIDQALIVNTSGHAGQVTAASQDRETQLGEYSYLYEKHLNNRVPNLRVCLFFFRLFRSYRLKSLSELNQIRGSNLQPATAFRILIALSRIQLWKRKT